MPGVTSVIRQLVLPGGAVQVNKPVEVGIRAMAWYGPGHPTGLPPGPKRGMADEVTANPDMLRVAEGS
jgi:hypothetical protein